MAVATQRTWPVAGAVGVALLTVASASWIYANNSVRDPAALNRSVSAQGNVYQFGAPVGWASGARVLPSDTATVKFDEISRARNLVHGAEVEYSGYVLRITQIKQVQYSFADITADGRSTAAPDATLVQIVAKIAGQAAR